MVKTDYDDYLTVVGRQQHPSRKKARTDEDLDDSESSTPPANITIIPKEVIGKISTYLDINGVSNLLQVTSEKQTRVVITTSFLRHNFYFLRRYIIGSIHMRMNKKNNNKKKQRILAWMDVNKDWKEMYDYNPDDGTIISKIDKDIFDRIFNDIFFCVKFNLLDIVRHLLECRDVDVNTCQLYSTPLSEAVIHSETSVLNYILSNKDLDVNKVVGEHSGCSALHQIMKLLGIWDTTDPNNLTMLLSHPNININIQDNMGRTPLHKLCMLSCLNSSSIWKTNMLIEFGADVNIRDNRGKTTLDRLSDRSFERNIDEVIQETMKGLIQQAGGRRT